MSLSYISEGCSQVEGRMTSKEMQSRTLRGAEVFFANISILSGA